MSAASAKSPRRRWRPRFSLRTLLLVTACIGSSGALWIKRVPWRTTGSVQINAGTRSSPAPWVPSPDRHKAVIIGPAGTYLLDVDHLDAVQHVAGDPQKTVAWSQDSTRFLTSNADLPRARPGYQTKVWTAAPLSAIRSLPCRLVSITDFAHALSPDGKRVFTSAPLPSAGACCTDVDSGAVIWTNDSAFRELSVDPTGRFLFTGLHLLDAASGKVLWTSRINGVTVTSEHAFSADGRWFAVAFPCDDQWELHVYDTATFRESYTETRAKGFYSHLEFSPTGGLLGIQQFENSAGFSLDFRRTDGGESVCQLVAERDPYFEFFDDTHLIFASALREIATDQVLTKYPNCPYFSPDKRRALVHRAASNFVLCDSETGNEVYALPACDAAMWIDADRILYRVQDRFSVFMRFRSEGRFGLAMLPEFWAALLSLLGLIFSLRADWRKKVTA